MKVLTFLKILNQLKNCQNYPLLEEPADTSVHVAGYLSNGRIEEEETDTVARFRK